MPIDSSGNEYREVARGPEQIRVTYVRNGFDGSPAVRIQVREESGHLRFGPEIPVSVIGLVVREVVELLVTE